MFFFHIWTLQATLKLPIMTLNVRHNFESFSLLINKCTNYFKNIFLYIKKLFYQKGFVTESAPYHSLDSIILLFPFTLHWIIL